MFCIVLLNHCLSVTKMNGKNGYNFVHELKPIMCMILCQAASAGVSIFYKLAAANGMEVKILIFYRLIFATIFIAPIALVYERKCRPKLTCKIAFQGIGCGLLGATLGSNLYAESLVLTSATYAAAMSNLIPALTLLLSLVFRLEILDLRRSNGKAKVIGTALSIGGAMVLTFYKGTDINLWSTHINLVHSHGDVTKLHVKQNHFLGYLLAFFSCISYAAWFVLQTKMTQKYPFYSSTALMCFTGSVMAGVYGFFRERDWMEWKLGWNIRLLIATYTGIIGTGMATAIATWGTLVRGPLYVSSFSPLALIFVEVLGSLFLDEKLHLGSIIGSVIIVVGLYVVLWGKSKEMKRNRCTLETTSGTKELADIRGDGKSSSLTITE